LVRSLSKISRKAPPGSSTKSKYAWTVAWTRSLLSAVDASAVSTAATSASLEASSSAR
jgi:hypothetical protein